MSMETATRERTASQHSLEVWGLDLASQEPAAKRRVCNNANAQLTACGHNLFLQRIAQMKIQSAARWMYKAREHSALRDSKWLTAHTAPAVMKSAQILPTACGDSIVHSAVVRLFPSLPGSAWVCASWLPTSTSRVQMDHSSWQALIGCTACARLISSAEASEIPKYFTLPSLTSS